MNDGDIRRTLEQSLRKQHAGEPGTLIRHEMGICAGRRRIDVAVIGREISGYEIKSDADSLTRLAGQARDYGLVLDRATLVTAPRHLEGAERTLPSWWGITLAHRPEAALETLRKPGANPGADPFALAQLLWRAEAMEELKSRGLARGLSKKARHHVWKTLAESLPRGEIRDLVIRRLTSRPLWTGR